MWLDRQLTIVRAVASMDPGVGAVARSPSGDLWVASNGTGTEPGAPGAIFLARYGPGAEATSIELSPSSEAEYYNWLRGHVASAALAPTSFALVERATPPASTTDTIEVDPFHCPDNCVN